MIYAAATVNLDAKLRVQTRSRIAELQRRLGITTVYVTHDQTEAMTMGNRVAVLSNGKLQQVDTPRNLYDNPVNQFVAGFIGAGDLPGEVLLIEDLGADALLHVRLAGESNQVVARTEGRTPPAPGQHGTFHVQPDDIFALDPQTGARLAG